MIELRAPHVCAVLVLQSSFSVTAFLRVRNASRLVPRKFGRPTSTAIRLASRKKNSGPERGRARHQRNDVPSVEFPPPPPLTSGDQRRKPFYFTCRHTYEETLMEEIKRKCSPLTAINLSSPFPGLVRVETKENSTTTTACDNRPLLLPLEFDPGFALQTLPDCVVVSAESIKGLSREIVQAFIGKEEDSTDTQLQLRQEKEKKD